MVKTENVLVVVLQSVKLEHKWIYLLHPLSCQFHAYAKLMRLLINWYYLVIYCVGVCEEKTRILTHLK